MVSAELVNKDFEGDIAPDEKLHIKLQNAGNAPVLKNSRIVLKGTNQLSKLTMWLRGKLNAKEEDTLYVFVRQTFVPPQDARLKDLCDVSDQEFPFCRELDNLCLCRILEQKRTL